MSKKILLMLGLLLIGLLFFIYLIVSRQKTENLSDSMTTEVKKNEGSHPHTAISNLKVEVTEKQDPEVPKGNYANQNSLNEPKMMTQEEHLIFEATQVAAKSDSIPDGVKPKIKEEDNYTSVYWPMPQNDSDVPVLGPTIAVEVYFDKNTLEVTGALGSH